MVHLGAYLAPLRGRSWVVIITSSDRETLAAPSIRANIEGWLKAVEIRFQFRFESVVSQEKDLGSLLEVHPCTYEEQKSLVLYDEGPLERLPLVPRSPEGGEGMV